MSRRPLTTAEFVERARKVHGEKYSYGRVIYKNSTTKVEIVCPTHGSFYQMPSNHIGGQGCPPCGGRYKYDNENFIQKAIDVHGSRYSYELVCYKSSTVKVQITCAVHGPFSQRPSDHLQGHGCILCRDSDRAHQFKKSADKFVEEAVRRHGQKYDYSHVEYKNNKTPITIVCPQHGKFQQIPKEHLKGGCLACAYIERGLKESRHAAISFIAKAIVVHDGKYDYSRTLYKKSTVKIAIICPEHGEFFQTPSDHLSGYGCKKCAVDRIAAHHRSSTDDFIGKSVALYGEKYDYSKVEYCGSKDNVVIICKRHGEFKQTPNSHLRGQGCPTCNESRGEKEIAAALDKMNIEYKRQATFKSLRYKGMLKFDFFIPSLAAVIEYDGLQHYSPIEYWGGESGFVKLQIRDAVKTKWASLNGYHLIRIRFDDNIIAVLERGLKRAKRLQNTTTTPFLFVAA